MTGLFDIVDHAHTALGVTQIQTLDLLGCGLGHIPVSLGQRAFSLGRVPKGHAMREFALTERQCEIIAHALSLCPLAELGDRIGGDDHETWLELIGIARLFDQQTANDMVMQRMVYLRDKP